MPEITEQKKKEVVVHQGTKFVRLNPEDIDTSKMTMVLKVTDVVAAQVKNGKVKVVTKHGNEIETINYAKEGDWVVYDIGSSDFKRMIDKILNCSISAIGKNNFGYLYRLINDNIGLEAQDQMRVIQSLIMDNDDNKEFDGSFVKNLKRYQYIGKPVYAGYVPFNFVLRAPWGEDQFIKRGGFVIYDTNYEREMATMPGNSPARDAREAERMSPIYGMEGSKDRVAGEFEKTYSIAPSAEKKIIADTFKMALAADRSPIAGIQFNNVDLAKAYERAGKVLPSFLERFSSE